MATINAVNNRSAPFTVSAGNCVVTTGNVSTAAGSITSATTLTATLGNAVITDGNLSLVDTAAGKGLIYIASPRTFFATGTGNIFVGIDAGNNSFNTTYNINNTGIGYRVLRLLAGTSGVEGSNNTGAGAQTFAVLTTGHDCTALGYSALTRVTTGAFNTQIGYGPLGTVTGSFNTLIGGKCAENLDTSDSSNIYIGAYLLGTAGDNHKLRIGVATGTSTGQLDAAYICGIYGATSGTTCSVMLVDSANKISGSGPTGNTGDLFTSNGATSIPTWQSVPGGPTVLTWLDATADVTAAANTGYTINHATPANLLTVTLPATAVVGTVVSICGSTSGGWKLSANTGQTIKLGNQTSTTAGYIASSNQYDTAEVVCITADTTWVTRKSIGNITYA